MVVAYKISDETIRVTVKGAPEEIIRMCTYRLHESSEQILFNEVSKNNHLDQIGKVIEDDKEDVLKALSYAYRDWPKDEFEILKHKSSNFATKLDREKIESDLIFAATFWLKDPLRNDAKEVISDLKDSGTNTRVLSGDHRATVSNTLEKLGMSND
jgi:magnesium-transporting ATPase (P-type)